MTAFKPAGRPPAAAIPAPPGRGGRGADVALLQAQLPDPEVFIEITNQCNFHCPFCRSKEVQRRAAFMKRRLFDHVLVQLPALTTRPIYMHVSGEPTLHPEFFQLVRSSNALGIRVLLATNATGLDVRFLDLEMDILIYLSTDKDEFSRRSSIPFEEYLGRIERYAAAWLVSGSPQNISFAVYFASGDRGNPARVGRQMSFLRGFVHRLGLGDPNCLPEDGVGVDLCRRREDGRTVRVCDLDLHVGGLYPNPGNAHLPGRSHPQGKHYGFCDSAWRRLAVLVDGKLAYCCRDLTAGTAFTKPGQILKSSLRSLWLDDPGINRIRRELLEHKIRNSVCQTCLDAHQMRDYRCNR